MDFQSALRAQATTPVLQHFRLGIEREAQRITPDGELAHTDHPHTLGDRSYHPFIQTDFAESQLELITPVATSVSELFDWLSLIHHVTYQNLTANERLWPLSMPPKLPDNETDITIAKLADPADVAYREGLAQRYGHRKQMVSGIHFNFEFAPELVTALFDAQTETADLTTFKTKLYFKVTRNYLRYRWLITYLFGATPTSESGYFTANERPQEPVRSIRNSHFGYTNHADVRVSYQDLPHYLNDLTDLVANGQLSKEKEFYAPVRFRGGHQVSDLHQNGVRYIELRNLDINPFAPYGVSPDEINFLTTFMLYLLWTDEQAPADQWVQQGDQLNEQVALENPLTTTAAQAEGQRLLAGMRNMCQQLHLTACLPALNNAAAALADPQLTISGQLYRLSQASTQKQLAITLATQHAAWFKSAPTNNHLLSRLSAPLQALLLTAIQRGINVCCLPTDEPELQCCFNQRTIYAKTDAISTNQKTWSPVNQLTNSVPLVDAVVTQLHLSESA
ncbi:bifunctional glutamate--cysteine ligase GshA/glutathione synthetase GshB [Secundilactobacillus muriivasis]